ncbi:unnamed protein product [Owenia fusiformis]|uniref:Protein kinase domain-containing protein n=1 Tax=Owenia fusiformis TaxID=6347 RepID=A0A8S4NZZ2_OWEFU|nr:unnamed protein product [Owenia fusiformis]
MGAEVSALTDCDLEEPINLPSQKNWTIHPARKKDGTRVTVFRSCTDVGDDLLETAAKNLKVLRHPLILKFFAICKSGEDRCLVTEDVYPLETVLESLTSVEICAGMYSIIEAIAFLHDCGHMCHNNIALSSIYVSQDGTWRLGGTEFLCRFEDASQTFLQQSRSMRDEKTIAPEEKSEKYMTDPATGHARDVFAFGVLVEALLECIGDMGELAQGFERTIQDYCLNPDPTLRPKISTLLSDRLFSNEFVEITNFLRNITLKSLAEKEAFFKSILKNLLLLPESLIATRLVRPLLSRFVVLDATANEHLLPHLLTPRQENRESVSADLTPLLSESLYQAHIIPEIYKIFHVRDSHVRLVLLRHFHNYFHLFDDDTLAGVIQKQLLLGLRDTNDEIVAASLRALADIVPILGGEHVIGGTRLKVFAEGKPKFTTDRLVGLGKNLSSVLNAPIPDSIRHKVDNHIVKSPKVIDEGKMIEKQKKKEDMARRRKEQRRKREEARKKKEADIISDDTLQPNGNVTHLEAPIPNNVANDTQETIGNNQHSESFEYENDSDVENEIEEELKQLDSSSNSQNSSRSSKSFIGQKERTSPPITVDWSNARSRTSPSESSHKDVNTKPHQGALKLSQKDTLAKENVKSTESADFDDEIIDSGDDEDEWVDWDQNMPESEVPQSEQKFDGLEIQNNWGNEHGVWGHSSWENDVHYEPSTDIKMENAVPDMKSYSNLNSAMTSQYKTKSENLKKTNQGKNISERALGEEFDVLAIEIKPMAKTESEEIDFFSDMAPTVKPTLKINTSPGNKNKTDFSFAATDMSEEAIGWEDDGGWGDADFDKI